MRRVVDGVLVSPDLPPLRLRPAASLGYVGAFAFQLKAIAEVERHVFAQTHDGDIARMLVVQFESYLPWISGVYRYALTEPREIGGATYGTSESLLVVSEETATEPNAEMARTVRFLEEHGLRLADRQAMARFARIVGDDRRSEVLIFYHDVGGPVTGVIDRALAQFSLE